MIAAAPPGDDPQKKRKAPALTGASHETNKTRLFYNKQPSHQEGIWFREYRNLLGIAEAARKARS